MHVAHFCLCLLEAALTPHEVVGAPPPLLLALEPRPETPPDFPLPENVGTAAMAAAVPYPGG